MNMHTDAGTHPLPDRSGYFMDLSDNNPIPDLHTYRAAGHVWLALKVSEGVGYHWFAGDQIADAWHALGGRVVHYHWLRPDANVDAQASYFLNLVAPHWKQGDLTMNDWERSTNYATGQPVPDGPEAEWAARAAAFNNACQARFGAHIIYSGNWYLDGKPHMQAEARRWPVILSDYTGGDAMPNDRFGLKLWARQFSSSWNVPGESRAVDYNHILNPALIEPAKPPTPPDLLEQIMALDRNSADYKQFVADVAAASSSATFQRVRDLIVLLLTGKKQKTADPKFFPKSLAAMKQIKGIS